MKKFSFLIIISVLFFFAVPVFAQEVSIGTSRIDASSPFYFLKAVREIIELKFAKTTQDIANIQLEFATRRIREVKSLASSTHEDLIEPTLERYARHLQELKGRVYPKDEVMVNKVNANITAQLNVLQDVFKQVSDSKAQRSISLAIFRISEDYVSSKPAACDFLSKEASSSALGEVEKYVYLGRTNKCRGLKL